MPDVKLLRCVTCPVLYSVEDVERGDFFIETMVCLACYEKMAAKHYTLSCFGKPTVIFTDGKRLLGYNPAASECREYCPDRNLCRKWLEKR